jgi:hypothetical protein
MKNQINKIRIEILSQKELKMKKILSTLTLTLMMSGCVISPDRDFYPDSNLDVSVGAGADFNPRIYNGTRSNVSVWLHPTYTVADAYPIAQAHCSRWGFYARPSNDWSISTSYERRLNYSCVSYRPVLSGPHIIIGSPFYRNHYRHWHHGRGHVRGRVQPRRGTFGRGGIRNGRRGTVYTPKPTPRHSSPSVRRGTFGRVFKPSAPATQNTTVQRGKPWEHNKNKNTIPNPGTTVQRGKPWEHNTNKGEVTTPRVAPRYKSKRSTFGNSGSGNIRNKTTYKSGSSLGSGFGSRSVKSNSSNRSRSGFSGIRPKNSSRRSSKGKLTL